MKMLAIDFLKLAKDSRACKDGLLWLAEWMKNHPNGYIHEFFKDKKNPLKEPLQLTFNRQDLKENTLEAYEIIYQGVCCCEECMLSEIQETITSYNEWSYLIWCIVNMIEYDEKEYQPYEYKSKMAKIFSKNRTEDMSNLSQEELCNILIKAYTKGYVLE